MKLRCRHFCMAAAEPPLKLARTMADGSAAAAPAPTRRYYIGGNWKCAATKADMNAVIDALNGMGVLPENTDVVINPPALMWEHTRQRLRADVHVGFQNIHTAEGFGAFTGEHTVALLRDYGVDWTLVGHSERRQLFGETDAIVAKKTQVALKAGINTVVCIGETLEEREAGHTMAVVERQLGAVAAVLSHEDWARIVIAYEPVWAIGTGKVATPEQAQEVHANLRRFIGETVGADIAAATRIIYGGSVKGSSSVTLIREPDIDGFLVGGASVKPEFVDIVKSACVGHGA